jgi:DNA-binding transcriptional LysR family regulator
MHIEDLELTQIRLLEAIHETGNLSAAAQAIGLTQSAASHSLARLRKTCADPLFVRTSKGMRPTPYGEQFCSAARGALALLREGAMSGRSFSPASSTRIFSLYMSEAGQLLMLPPLLAYLREHAPGVRIRVSRVPEKDQGAALESGDIDLAIGHITTMTTGFHRRLLFHERYVCLASAENELFKQGMSLEAFKQARHAIADSSGMAHWMVDQQLALHGVVRRIGLISPEFMTLPFVIQDTDLVVTLPGRLADRFARLLQLRVMPLPLTIDPYEILLLWHQRAHLDPANRWLRQTFVQLFQPWDSAPPKLSQERSMM